MAVIEPARTTTRRDIVELSCETSVPMTVVNAKVTEQWGVRGATFVALLLAGAQAPLGSKR
jgi:hypothetical protein